jgi:hypothetical protein
MEQLALNWPDGNWTTRIATLLRYFILFVGKFQCRRRYRLRHRLPRSVSHAHAATGTASANVDK